MNDRHEHSRAAIAAARHMDWMQIVCHQGVPCFHVDETTGHFCGRARTWAGHVESHDHAFVSLEDLLTRALDYAAEQQAAPTWLPIETAPKDGTDIFLYTDTIIAGYWLAGYWRDTSQGLCIEQIATHWMPLPATPPPAPSQISHNHNQ